MKKNRIFRNEYSNALVTYPLKSSILFLPPKQRIDRSYLLHIWGTRDTFALSLASDLREEGQSVLKARLWFCFNFKRARAKARKCVRGRIGAREFSRPLKYIVLWSHLLLPFFLSFFFYYYYSIVCCVQVSVPFDGMETRKNRLEEIYGVLFLLEGSGIFWIFQFLENNEPLIETMDFSFRFKREAKD